MGLAAQMVLPCRGRQLSNVRRVGRVAVVRATTGRVNLRMVRPVDFQGLVCHGLVGQFEGLSVSICQACLTVRAISGHFIRRPFTVPYLLLVKCGQGVRAPISRHPGSVNL